MNKAFLSIVFSFYLVGLLFASGSVPVYSNSEEKIKIKAGEEFVISLEAKKMPGYEWQFAKAIDGKILQLVDTKSSLKEKGAIEESIFVLKALNKGETLVSFKHARAGENDMYPLDSKTFVIIVE